MTIRVLAIGEGRGSESGDRDATMMDVGERARPPGDPPDAAASYASKGVGTNGGGMPVPESLIDDVFVSERLRVEFPNGEDGEPSITIEPEVLEAMNGMWKQCMIVRVLGRNVPISALSKKLRGYGTLKEEWGPWRAFGSYLMVRAWSPEFDPLRDDIVTTPFERARFARVCVEVNLAKPLKGTVLINGERYFVAYEGLAEICSKCGIYGHLVDGCPRTITEILAEVAIQTEAQSATRSPTRQEPIVQENGFTPVRSSRRGTQILPRLVNGRTAEAGGETDRNVQEIPRTEGIANIAISNKFGSLELDTDRSESRKEIVSGEENKENQIMNIKRNENKEISQGKETLIFGGKVNIRKDSKMVNKEKWVGKKVVEGARGRPKNLNNKPARGLVFGPTKGEVSLSESGKRLRVESLEAGRAGGAFRESVAEPRVTVKPLQLRDEELENPMDSTISEMEQRETEAQMEAQGDKRILDLA
ncbi:uncharacterized protein LOC111198274 [Brassica napus]|uniref:uncharacterized protein LOC111198274 n=1 Tax=Brassica napus TaxID=3708 RepID=UPI00207A3F04|nr:uncharacterized protein LOC111198274 [Brassica napus]